MTIIIYKHTNTISGKCYIGKTKSTIEKRWKAHVNAALKGKSFHISHAIRKYPLDSWIHETLESTETTADANICESKWISIFNSNDCNHGYNMTPGGDGGKTSNPEEMSKKMKNVPKTPEHKEKMRQAQKKYWSNPPASDTRRQKLAERNATQKAKQTSKDTQVRRWSNPESKEAVKKLWQDPIWRSKELTRRKKARELKKLRLSETVDISVIHIPERIA